MKNRITILAIGLAIGVIVAAVFLAINNAGTGERMDSAGFRYEEGAVSVLSPVDIKEEGATLISNFLEDAVSGPLLPDSINLTSPSQLSGSQGQDDGGGLVANWSSQGQNLTLLYDYESGSFSSKYIRVWSFTPFQEKLNEEVAGNLASNLFRKNFLDNSSFSCEQAELQVGASTTSTSQGTRCYKMFSSEGGSQRGVTIQGPITPPSGDDVVFVGACLVPQVGAPAYPVDWCL